MAYGTELILGFGYPKLIEVAEAIGIKITFDGDDPPEEFMDEAAMDAINTKLEKAWTKAIRDGLGLTVACGMEHYKRGGTGREALFVSLTGAALTPGTECDDPAILKSIRQAQPFNLGLYYDPDECGDSKEDAVFGISLITRYYPCFLDLDKPHGGSGDVVKLDKATLAKIEIARAAIVTVLPQWDHAEIIVKELHY